MAAFALFLASGAFALTAGHARAIAVGKTDARIEALNQAVAAADDRTAAFIQALSDEVVKIEGGRVFIVRDGKATDPVTGGCCGCWRTRDWTAGGWRFCW